MWINLLITVSYIHSLRSRWHYTVINFSRLFVQRLEIALQCTAPGVSDTCPVPVSRLEMWRQLTFSEVLEWVWCLLNRPLFSIFRRLTRKRRVICPGEFVDTGSEHCRKARKLVHRRFFWLVEDPGLDVDYESVILNFSSFIHTTQANGSILHVN